MAVQNVVILAVFLLSCQCAISEARQCHPLNIELCLSRNKNTDGCTLYSKATECLNDLLDNGNCSDSHRLYAVENLNTVANEKSMCVELPEGDCFHHQLGKCMTELYPTTLYGDIKDEHCTIVDKFEAAAVECVKDLKLAYTEHKIQETKFSIWQRMADCWFWNKYEKKTHQ